MIQPLIRKLRNKRVLFLDLDNTLYLYDPCHRHALRKTFETYRKLIERIPWETFLRHYHHARETVHRRLQGQAASHSRLLYFQILLELQLNRTDPKHSLYLEKIYWDAFLERMQPVNWAHPFIKGWKAREKIFCIVTNLTAEIQMKKLQRLKLDQVLDFMVSSEEAGVEKPASGIFRLALKKAGANPTQVLVMGDNPSQDRCRFLDFVRTSPHLFPREFTFLEHV